MKTERSARLHVLGSRRPVLRRAHPVPVSTSGFADSRRAIEGASKTLFRQDPPATRARKLAAIAAAFDEVGISAVPTPSPL
jgi:hypothetical protein